MEARASFPPEPASAPSARHFAERTLLGWDLPALFDTARLLVSELVINAVLHAGSESVLVLRLGSRYLRVEVSDRSTEVPRMSDYSPSAPSGRGLLILDDLADRWGVEVGERGKTVWFELALEPLPVAVEPSREGARGNGS